MGGAQAKNIFWQVAVLSRWVQVRVDVILAATCVALPLLVHPSTAVLA
jgi:hypothetical protein